MVTPMSNTQKKLKKEKKARAKAEKAKAAQAWKIEEKKANQDSQKPAQTFGKNASRAEAKPSGSKPSGRPSSAPVHRTQGK